jgi:hypothetical protein
MLKAFTLVLLLIASPALAQQVSVDQVDEKKFSAAFMNEMKDLVGNLEMQNADLSARLRIIAAERDAAVAELKKQTAPADKQ